MTVPAQNCVDYSFFAELEELLVWEQDGIEVRGIATHRFREDRVRLIAPFEVEGADYLIGFRPLLVALAASMIARRRSLEERGLTVTDECRRMCEDLFRLHSTRLEIAPQIDREHKAYLEVFQPELDALKAQGDAAKRAYKALLRKLSNKRKNNEKPSFEEISEQVFIRKFAQNLDNRYERFKSDVEHELWLLKKRLIRAALKEPLIELQPLQLKTA